MGGLGQHLSSRCSGHLEASFSFSSEWIMQKEPLCHLAMQLSDNRFLKLQQWHIINLILRLSVTKACASIKSKSQKASGHTSNEPGFSWFQKSVCHQSLPHLFWDLDFIASPSMVISPPSPPKKRQTNHACTTFTAVLVGAIYSFWLYLHSEPNNNNNNNPLWGSNSYLRQLSVAWTSRVQTVTLSVSTGGAVSYAHPHCRNWSAQDSGTQQ